MNKEQRERMFEGLAGVYQESLPPEEAKKVEDIVKSFLDKHPSGYNLSYGGNSSEDSAYVGFHKANDYSGGKPEIVYQTPYKFKRDLHAVANKVWRTHQDAEYSKKFPTTEPNKDDVLKQLDAASKHHDWYYNYSDDHRVWSSGQKQASVINNALEKAAVVDPEGAKEIVKKNYPKDFQDGALKMIDNIHANKSKWSRNYKV